MSRKLILDLDTGIDDALAIAYALGSPEAELIGITATYGNVLMERSVRNSLAVLDILGASSVPVHPGLPHSSTAEDFSVQEISAFIHGRNGVGEVDIAPSPRSAEATGAVDFIIEASHRYGDELVYVPTGPLTNLAAALEKDPGLAERRLRSRSALEGLLRSWAGPHTREALAEEAPYYAELLSRPGAARSALEPLRNLMLSRAETAALDKPVAVPVLSVQGELDPVQPAQAYARDTHHVAGNLRQVTVHRSGHFPQEETPAGFVQALLPFLADVAPPASA